MANGGDSNDSPEEGIDRRQLLGAAGVGGLALLAGCSRLGGSGSGVSVSENGTLVVSDVENINLGEGASVLDSAESSVTVGTTAGGDTLAGSDIALGELEVESLHMDTGNRVTFGDENQVGARYDIDTGFLEVKGGVQFSNGTLKGPYDTNDYVHDMLLPGMHAYATDAVGAQDNVLGFADEWAEVTHTPISDGGRIAHIFKPGPAGWAGWSEPDDFPVEVTITGLEEDWGPGRAMVMFRNESEAGLVSLETRSDGSWESAAERTGNEDQVVVLDPSDATRPVSAIRWTFDEPIGKQLRVIGLFYYSMSVKGNTWLPKARGETTGITLLPRSPPDPPDEGSTLFLDRSSGDVSALTADGAQVSLGDGSSIAASGTVTLSAGEATVDTGITEPGRHLTVRLDPSGGQANTSTVSVKSAVVWDSSAGEYRVKFWEEGTDIGDSVIGYEIVVS